MVEEIVHSYLQLREQILHLLTDVADEVMTVQPRDLPNHATWTLGHLIVSCQAVGEELGIPQWLDDRWTPLFGQGTQPEPKRTRYPEKDFLIEAYLDASNRVVARLREIGPRGLRAPLPDERYRNALPTVGHAVLTVLLGHTAQHLGQLISWKRAIVRRSL